VSSSSRRSRLNPRPASLSQTRSVKRMSCSISWASTLVMPSA
jgi:hypothetical protein